ncbi:MAG: hypothetical protein PVG71_10810 [Anaerolineae bacterium]|jgi:hypothetical protein
MLGHPTPAEADPKGHSFTFEAGATKQRGGQGWADVWKKGRFAWGCQGKHADLEAAYQPLLQYREALENPSLLVVSDIGGTLIHTNFVNTVKQVYEITPPNLLVPVFQSNGLELRCLGFLHLLLSKMANPFHNLQIAAHPGRPQRVVSRSYNPFSPCR